MKGVQAPRRDSNDRMPPHLDCALLPARLPTPIPAAALHPPLRCCGLPAHAPCLCCTPTRIAGGGPASSAPSHQPAGRS